MVGAGEPAELCFPVLKGSDVFDRTLLLRVRGIVGTQGCVLLHRNFVVTMNNIQGRRLFVLEMQKEMRRVKMDVLVSWFSQMRALYELFFF